ncbi:MAG: AAA family ATPase [Polyangia bacterium]
MSVSSWLRRIIGYFRPSQPATPMVTAYSPMVKLQLDLFQRKLNHLLSPQVRHKKAPSDKATQLATLTEALATLDEASLSDPERQVLSDARRFADCLLLASQVSSLYQIAQHRWIELPTHYDILFPSQLLEAIASLRQISDTVDRAMETTAQLSKTTTLWEVSEQVVHLTRAQYALKELGDGFGPILALIIGHFADVLTKEGERVRKEQTREPVANPYVIGNPVQGSLFVGREDVLRRLEELWGGSGQCPSVLLYGHRRMGKSSVLQNLRQLKLPHLSVLVDFNLQRLGRVRSTAELLHGLSLKLFDAAQQAGLGQNTLSEPAETDFLGEHKNPYLALDRFLDRLGRVRDGHRFLVTVDEFELIEEQIDEGRLERHLLASFRATFQTYPWLIMALAGLHRLEELRHDYWHPLFGSVAAIEVSFLSDGAARTLITLPTPSFPLDFDADAISRILALTHGQPYLIQLICHSLVARYNRQLREDPVPPLRRFDRSDVDAVVEEPELFTDGIRYFQGVWDHAARSLPTGQTQLLSTLAPHPQGLSQTELVTRSELSSESARAALRALVRHAVLQTDGIHYQFTVELLRRWILAQPDPNGLPTAGSVPAM